MSDFIDYCLKAETEEDMAIALDFARVQDEEGNDVWRSSGENFALDVIGDMVVVDPVFSEDGELVSPAEMDGGFHANLRTFGDFDYDLSEVVINPQPSTPKRIFA